jgi:SAM-dependent methyltransferase
VTSLTQEEMDQSANGERGTVLHSSSLPEHVRRNRAYWDDLAESYRDRGHDNWADNAVAWGMWHVPEANLGILPGVDGLDVIELGCGTAYVSSWLERRGARVVGIDNSPAQLETARSFQAEFGLEFPILLGNAEDVPYPDASFDLAISEYGASIWCDPYRWIPEASRLLRPGGQLIFLVNGVLLMLCVPDEDGLPANEVLKRDYFGMHRFEWPDDDSVEFHLGHGEMIRLLRENGFDIERLVEIQPPEGSTTNYSYVTLDWVRRWPGEEVWIARKLR